MSGSRSNAPLALLGVTFIVAACAKDVSVSPSALRGERTGTRTAELASADIYGTSLPAKALALTFDDGPGARTAELSAYLKAQGIRAAFFVNGAHIAATTLPNPNGVALVPNANAILAQLVSDDHLVANHTTTHRSLTGVSSTPAVPASERVQDLAETDAAIAAYVPSGHFLFRAPFGDWNNAVWTTLNASAMSKYVGPIYWEQGGFSDQYPNAAADWACWQGAQGAAAGGLANGTGYATTQQCGDAYIAEIYSVGKGIVLLHDPYEWAQGSTVDMVKYMVPILKANGYSFVRLDEVPAIAAALPCHASCVTCAPAVANQCTSCAVGKYLSGGSCAACTACPAGTYQTAACSPTANTTCAPVDAGAPDAAAPDAGGDAGGSDAGGSDASPGDASSGDASPADASPDGGSAADASSGDASSGDASSGEPIPGDPRPEDASSEPPNDASLGEARDGSAAAGGGGEEGGCSTGGGSSGSVVVALGAFAALVAQRRVRRRVASRNARPRGEIS